MSDSDGQAGLARAVVAALGGRYGRELGIDVDTGPAEVERWFLAATLFGTRISAAIAERTFVVLNHAGLRRMSQALDFSWDDLVGLLDAGGYARYDFRTATRLHDLARVVRERYDGEITALGKHQTRYPELRRELDELPGWGRVTISLFLRELRGVWPGAQPPLDERAAKGARHLRLADPPDLPDPPDPEALSRLARRADLDPRDLESALVRLALARGHRMDSCPGGADCTLLAADPATAGTRSRARTLPGPRAAGHPRSR
jgi:hypothetical protein